jgi:hypothetical protein
MTPGTSERPTIPKNNLYTAAWFLLLSCFVAVAAYYSMFTGFSPWDDEGALMISVKNYLAGFRLYDEVFSGYGPVYYFYNWFIQLISGSAVTHDATRMTSVVIWVVCPLISAWIALRLTDSLLSASVAHLLSFRSLQFFVYEPGHPQELCILLLLGLAASGLIAARPGRRSIGAVLVGAICAALLLIKVNIGIFVVLSAALAFLYLFPQTTLSLVARVAAMAAAVALPVLLMKAHLDGNAARSYCFVVTASAAALAVGPLSTVKSVSVSLRDGFVALASFLVTGIASILVLLAKGISLQGILFSLVLVHVKVNVEQRFWYLSSELGLKWIFWALGGLIAAFVFARNMRRDPGAARRALVSIKLIFGASAVLVALAVPSVLLGFVTPYCWLVLYSPQRHGKFDQALPRFLLGITAVLQTLYAYPIAGSQAAFIRELLVIVSAVCVGDALAEARDYYTIPDRIARWIRPATIGILLCVPLYYIRRDFKTASIYRSLPASGLAGAERVHMPAEQVSDYHWLVTKLRSDCDVFIGMPDLPSFTFWTGKEPLTKLSVDDWMFALSNEQQSYVVSVLAKHPDACVFYNPGLVAFWNKAERNLDALPLAHYIHENFKVAEKKDLFYFMVRKERDLAL